MNVFEEKAQFAAENLVKQGVDKVYAFDPTIIMVLIEVFKMLFEMFQNCRKKPTDIVNSIQNPNWAQRFLLRRTISRALKNADETITPDAVFEACLVTGLNTDLEEVKTMLNNIN